ncbi:MAG TPA: class I SAM-dependent methyltransferase [Puia sp.]|nr:class I SAM-dependent methyltransferase [Puia sp.]
MTDRNFALEYDDSYKKYDMIVKLFQLGRDRIHRLRALQFAGLKKGDTVLDICCGSGLSLEPIISIIGNTGKVIAVDANKNMLSLAKQRAAKHKWNNIEFIEADINSLTLNTKADLALFALCWYDRKICTEWVHSISQFLKRDSGVFCFMDYKFPENWVKHIAKPVLKLLVKWLGEAYNVDDLKWDPTIEIGSLLIEPKFNAYYFDSIFTICGKPK